MNETAKVAPANEPARASTELWLFTLDPDRIARVWAVTAGLALVAGVVLALGLAFAPLADFGGADDRRATYTMHGIALVFLVVLPAIPGVAGNALLPRLVGADGPAWPRANLLGLQLHLAGVVLFALAFLAAPADSGWTFDVPFSLTSGASLGWSLLALVAVVAGGACTAANILATIASSRARDGAVWSMPLLAWALGASAIVQLLAAPILAVVAALLFAERSGASDVLGSTTAAGDVRFAQWFFAFAHPAIGAALLACAGLVDHLVAGRAQREEAASATSVYAIFGFAVAVCVSAAVQAFARVGSPASSVTSSALFLATGIPLAVLAAGWISRAARAAGTADATRCLGAAAGVLLACAALASILLALPAVGALLAGTTFATVPVHFAGVAVAAAVFGALHELAPVWFGAAAREGRGRAASVLLVVGSITAFGPAIVRGLAGEPHRAFTLRTGSEVEMWVAAGGAVLLAFALALAGWNVIAAFLASRVEERA